MPLTKKRIYCTFPKELIREPILYNLGKNFDVIPNIRGASISDDIGLVYLELEGDEGEVEKAMQFLIDRNVKLDPVIGE
jgi:L-aspartate semialdehyde sulfurtransferase ferredoxin